MGGVPIPARHSAASCAIYSDLEIILHSAPRLLPLFTSHRSVVLLQEIQHRKGNCFPLQVLLLVRVCEVHSAHLRVPLEEGFPQQELRKDASNGPQIDSSAVELRSQQNFRRSVVLGHHLRMGPNIQRFTSLFAQVDFCTSMHFCTAWLFQQSGFSHLKV